MQTNHQTASSATSSQPLCRTCRSEQDSRTFQVPVEAQDINGKCIADMIYELTDIMVSLDRHLPQSICPRCLEELRAAYGFRQKCIESNTILCKMVPSVTGAPNDATEFLVVKTENYDLDQPAFEDDYELVDVDLTKAKSPKESTAKKRKTQNVQVPKQTYRSAAGRTKLKFREIVLDCVTKDGPAYNCTIDKSADCKYSQPNAKLDLGNFVRHCRLRHPEAALEAGLLVYGEGEVIDPREIKLNKRQKLDQSRRYMMGACIKLLAVHNLPLHCFTWESFRILLDPLKQAIKFEISGADVLDWTHMAVENLLNRIRQEMHKRLVSVKVDSARHGGQHYLTVSAQFEKYQTMVMRVLGVIRVTKELTAEKLSGMILKLLSQYDLSNEQIFALVLGNEASMLAVDGKLQKTFANTVSSIDEWDLATGEDADNVDTLLDEVLTKLRGQFNVIRGAVCSLQQVISSVVSKFDTNIDRIHRFVRDARDKKYKQFFEKKKASYPPLCSTNPWHVQYGIARSIIQQEQFYTMLGRKYSELALNGDEWKFLRDYNDAFLPLHEMIELVQGEQPPKFSEFYMRLLLSIKDVRGKTDNQFSAPLVEALTRQLVLLKENMVYKAALYLDPRFNYLRSVMFTAEQKEEVQNYVISIWNRIQNLRPGIIPEVTTPVEVKQEEKKDDMDDFLTEMFGGPSEGSSKSLPIPMGGNLGPIIHQLKSLEIETRQTHTYDVWKHWLLRADSHPELFAVAMVVLSLPSNNVNLERAYSALVLSDRRDGLSEKNLEELLFVRLNRNLFEKVVVSVGDWKQVLRST